ncbi:aminoacylase-1-like [Ceratina calcarata]|uniref:N-acyl-aliphatic-L-amino acid amidohydrolase n=1 Tax=Ceratina calcarata TaxID=156304 RepID=A0AAJ7ITF4_9HYME|nr:aminoacylase-1-like [Ceratina calcarata]
MSSSSSYTKPQLDSIAVENFREYLRIPSVQPNVNYDECVAFLQKLAKSLELPVKIHHCHADKPIVILTWTGKDPSKPTILLNSHMDVVPVFEDQWTQPPFSAYTDDHGNIYGRGAQDMKCVGIQYLEAIRRMKLNGQSCERTIHVLFVPDEEIGGILGMKEFVHTKEFKDLNVGFAMDEGVASPDETFFLFYNERSIWQVNIECTGTPGHGSLLADNTAGEKMRIVIDRFMDYRANEKAKMKGNSVIELGDVTTINLMMLSGGIQANVLPTSLKAVFDVRLDISVEHADFAALIKKWCEEAGPGVKFTFKQRNAKVESTKLDDSNPYWVALKKAYEELGLKVRTGIFPGATDSRYIRRVGIPAICFSPMNKTKILLHDHDEYLNKDIFLKGVEIYMKILASVGNI